MRATNASDKENVAAMDACLTISQYRILLVICDHRLASCIGFLMLLAKVQGTRILPNGCQVGVRDGTRLAYLTGSNYVSHAI